jgi:hypothetical protein
MFLHLEPWYRLHKSSDRVPINPVYIPFTNSSYGNEQGSNTQTLQIISFPLEGQGPDNKEANVKLRNESTASKQFKFTLQKYSFFKSGG